MTAPATRVHRHAPACVDCAATTPDVALQARGGRLVDLCREHGRPNAEKIRAELAEMWPALADDYWYGRVTEQQVFRTLCDHRPDISPHLRWELFNDLEAATALRRWVAEGYYRPADLECRTAEELDQFVQTRLDDAVQALLRSPAQGDAPLTPSPIGGNT